MMTVAILTIFKLVHLRFLGDRTQDHEVPPNRRAKAAAVPDELSTPEICDRPFRLPDTAPASTRG